MDSGREIYELIKELYPICRSITGDGLRETLKIIGRHIPLDIQNVPSGKKVFDWHVPREWQIKDAYVKDPQGKKIIDFKISNLHVLNYSVPVHKKVSLEELKEHLFTLPDYPDRIPYRTSYYNENWGFCLSFNQYKKLNRGTYEVCVDAVLKNGRLAYGELYLAGHSRDEILLSTYVCHPSLCNDNLSGPALLTFLAKRLMAQKEKPRYSYRFLFIPETIGAIAWLSRNERHVSKIKHGLVVTCVGDAGPYTYKKTRDGDRIIDRVTEKVLRDSGDTYNIIDFDPAYGSDERQYSSPGFNMPMGSLMRTPYAKYSEYHTSADNLDFINADSLGESLEKYEQIIFMLENNVFYKNLYPKGEPQLGKRGLYRLVGGLEYISDMESAMWWVLNLSDGKNSLLDIACRSKLSFLVVKRVADILLKHKLLRRENKLI